MSHIEPESIAAALEASNELLHMTDPSLRGGDDGTQGGLVYHYLTNAYGSPVPPRRQLLDSGANQTPNAEASSSAGYPRRRSPSPINHNIHIDPALAGIASTTYNAHAGKLDMPGTEYPTKLGDYGALGEMGGARKKKRHERAGWAELDEGPRKRGRKKGSGGEEGGGSMERGEMGDGSGMDSRGGMDNLARIPQGPDQLKAAKAEQNKRAQQAFRRRREERMKDLEAAAASLEPVQRRLALAEDLLADTNLSIEAAQIEIVALRTALKSFAAISHHSALTPHGTLAIEPESERSNDINPDRIDFACDILAQQSRELAKRNRAKREHEEYLQLQQQQQQQQQQQHEQTM